MERIITIVLLSLLMCGVCYAAHHDDITITTIAVSQLTPQKINDPSNPAISAVCEVTGNQINIQYDGRSPSASTGTPYTPATNTLLIIGGNQQTGNGYLNAFRAIAVGGAAVLHCDYFP
jgi:hypothetical protein